ncbi:unnamed protein product [Moneuplotes crassus]|uniref:Uncharacterized protein n=1 Tax=Euplotes crassus TaxID=5936 RepID=A0AAD1XCS2_EUPCR|nr:unnamed protein product [Moneuplotes crassus]
MEEVKKRIRLYRGNHSKMLSSDQIKPKHLGKMNKIQRILFQDFLDLKAQKNCEEDNQKIKDLKYEIAKLQTLISIKKKNLKRREYLEEFLQNLQERREALRLRPKLGLSPESSGMPEKGMGKRLVKIKTKFLREIRKQQELLVINSKHPEKDRREVLYGNLQLCYSLETDDKIKEIYTKKEQADSEGSDYDVIDWNEVKEERKNDEEEKGQLSFKDFNEEAQNELEFNYHMPDLLNSPPSSVEPEYYNNREHNISKKEDSSKMPETGYIDKIKRLDGFLYNLKDSIELFYQKKPSQKLHKALSHNSPAISPSRKLLTRKSFEISPNFCQGEDPPMIQKEFFPSSTWKELFGSFQHKALLLRCFANILKICLPYPIGENGVLTDGAQEYTLIPSCQANHDHNKHAYKMLISDLEFMHKEVSKLAGSQLCDFCYIDLIEKLCI